ncbi:MAG: hypothetical protein HQK77_20870 [Desulfobacterales bacterium]|nr:hypothetical protein [Desulfobacterales bacterium]
MTITLLNNIIMHCFWDYNYSVQDIENIIVNGTKQEKVYVLKKIICNSNEFFNAVSLFNKNELKELLTSLPNGSFKYEFQNIRLMALRNYYFGEENAPKRLRWSLP